MADFHSAKEIIVFAINLEKASQEFYEQLILQTESPSTCHFLRELAEQERIHEQKLQDILDADDLPLMLDRVDHDQVKMYIEAMDVPAKLDYKGAVKVAMDKEKASQMLYTILAGSVDNPGYAELFNKLAGQERLHKHFFETEYRRICISEN